MGYMQPRHRIDAPPRPEADRLRDLSDHDWHLDAVGLALVGFVIGLVTVLGLLALLESAGWGL